MVIPSRNKNLEEPSLARSRCNKICLAAESLQQTISDSNAFIDFVVIYSPCHEDSVGDSDCIRVYKPCIVHFFNLFYQVGIITGVRADGDRVDSYVSRHPLTVQISMLHLCITILWRIDIERPFSTITPMSPYIPPGYSVYNITSLVKPSSYTSNAHVLSAIA